jgi:hypothetical protein
MPEPAAVQNERVGSERVGLFGHRAFLYEQG